MCKRSLILYNLWFSKTARKRHHTAVSTYLYIMDSIRKYWLATGHQRCLLTNCCSLRTVWCLLWQMMVQVFNYMHCRVQNIWFVYFRFDSKIMSSVSIDGPILQPQARYSTISDLILKLYVLLWIISSKNLSMLST